MTAPPTLLDDRTLIVTCTGDGKLSGDVNAGAVPWWSVTKTCMAAAALILSERGKLLLDAALPGRAFTLRQLLRHDAGLRDYTAVPDYFAAATSGGAPWSETELLARVDVDRLAYQPGDGWTYSNVGYLLVRRAIESAFGADLEAALQALVFAPLGVRGVHIAREPGDISRGAFGNPRNYHPGWVYHGLLMGPPREAARWMHGLMTGRLLSPRLLAMMLERRALERAAHRPALEDRGLRARRHDGRRNRARPLLRPFRRGPRQRLRRLPLSRLRSAAHRRGFRAARERRRGRERDAVSSRYLFVLSER